MEQITVYEAIEVIVNRRKEEKRIPHCAILNDVASLTGLSIDELREEVRKLKKEGKIAIKETINSTSFYLI